MAEKIIAIWKNDETNWNAEDFIASHSEYKHKTEDQKFYIWETVILVAEELGLPENYLEDLLKENGSASAVDLFFAMFLYKLYGASDAAKYIGSETILPFQSIHQMIRDAESVLKEEDDKNVSDGANADITQRFEKMLNGIYKQYSTMQNTLIKEVQKTEEVITAVSKSLSSQKETSKPAVTVASEKTISDEELKERQKLAIENEILKYQLEHNKETTGLQIKLAETDSELKHVSQELHEQKERAEEVQRNYQDQIVQLQKEIVVERKAKADLNEKVEKLTTAYQAVVAANTKEMQRFETSKLLKIKSPCNQH